MGAKDQQHIDAVLLSPLSLIMYLLFMNHYAWVMGLRAWAVRYFTHNLST